MFDVLLVMALMIFCIYYNYPRMLSPGVSGVFFEVFFTDVVMVIRNILLEILRPFSWGYIS